MSPEIVSPEGKRFLFRSVGLDAEFASPFAGADFVCLLWANVRGVDDLERSHLAKALIATGCRYAVCAGHDCTAWHDAVDAAFLAQGLSEEEQERRFVMTTWHDKDSDDDVVFFFVWNTICDDQEFKNYLVLQIGEAPKREARLRKLVLKHSRGKEAA